MNALSRKIKHAGKLTSSQRSKLSSLYGEGIANAEVEEEVLRKGLVNPSIFKRLWKSITLFIAPCYLQSKLYHIRKIQQEMRVSARNSGDRVRTKLKWHSNEVI